jgi:hypothetical protein
MADSSFNFFVAGLGSSLLRARFEVEALLVRKARKRSHADDGESFSASFLTLPKLA